MTDITTNVDLDRSFREAGGQFAPSETTQMDFQKGFAVAERTTGTGYSPTSLENRAKAMEALGGGTLKC